MYRDEHRQGANTPMEEEATVRHYRRNQQPDGKIS